MNEEQNKAPHLKYEISNGVCLCPNCHATIDSNADKFPALKGTGTFNNLTPEQQQQILDFIKK